MEDFVPARWVLKLAIFVGILARLARATSDTTAATTSITQADNSSLPIFLRSFLNVISLAGRRSFSSLQQQCSLLWGGELSVWKMVQCLTLCGLLPGGLWLLGSRRGTTKHDNQGSVRPWMEELKGKRRGPGSVGSIGRGSRTGTEVLSWR